MLKVDITGLVQYRLRCLALLEDITEEWDVSVHLFGMVDLKKY